MAESVRLPIKVVGGERWVELSASAPSHTHEVCAETFKLVNEKFSFAGGHRVRLFRLKKNIHWRIPTGITLDITDVPPANAPRRQQRG